MRGSGKSTWAREAFSQATYIDLLQEGIYQRLLTDPRQFRAQLLALRERAWVVVDEVQRLPSLLNEVHALIEERRLQFALMGSSARKLRQAGTNLLGGRALRRTMAPLLPTELEDDFLLADMLRFGSLPLILQAHNPSEQLEAYTQLYLKEEIQAEALVRNLGGFARFLPVAALCHGQVVNTEALARDCGVARTTVIGFLDILEDTLLAFRLPAFEGRLRVKEKRHPKLYWLDNGVVRAIKRQLGEPTAEERGALFEGLIAQWLRAYQGYGRFAYDALYYWAVTGSQQSEVDFLIARGSEYWAIEVKATERLRDEHFKGLRAIADLKGLSRRVLVYLGDTVLQTDDGIEVWTVARLLAELEGSNLSRRSEVGRFGG
jgi:predicted AAA+ superfamily ATPase